MLCYSQPVNFGRFDWTSFSGPFSKKGDDITVLIQPAGSLGYARLKAAVTGIEGEFQEGHELDAKMTKKVPKAQISKPLTRKQATALLRKLS